MAQPRRFALALMAFPVMLMPFRTDSAQAQGDSWASPAPKPMMPPRRLLAAAAEGGKIYTFGGCGSPCFGEPGHNSASEETRVEVYDPEKDSWEEKKRMSDILFGAVAAAPGNGKIYIFGGKENPHLTREYDPLNDHWDETLESPMPTARYGPAAVTLGDKVYVLGGIDGSGPTGVVNIFDSQTRTWNNKPVKPMPTARAFLAAAAVDGKIYAIGGALDRFDRMQTDAVEIYNPVLDSWTIGAQLPVALQTSAAAGVNGKLYVFGGFNSSAGVQSTTFEYDPVANAWSAKAPMPTARDQAPAVVVDGFVYVLGGAVDCHCSALGDNEKYMPRGTTPPELNCSKTGPSSVAAGGLVTYTITVANTGGAAATGVTLKDPTPPGVTFVPSPGSLCGEGFPCSLNTIEAGQSSDPVNVTFRVPEACLAPRSIKNIARVKAQETGETTCRAEPTSVLGVAQKRDLAVSIEGPTEVERGAVANYVVEVTHTGAAMTGVIVKVKAPGATAIAPNPPVDKCVVSAAGEFTCDLGDFPEGSPPVPLDLGFRAPQGCPCPPPFDIKATVTANEEECDESNNNDTATTKVKCVTNLELTKTGPLCVNQGDPIAYTLKVINHGSDCACDVTLSDPIPAGLVSPVLSPGCKIAPPNQVNCSIGTLCTEVTLPLQFTVLKTVPDGSTISNTATVTASNAAPASATKTTVVPCCKLSISKTDGLDMAMPGQTLDYTIVASNQGSKDVMAIVDDTFPMALTEVQWCRDTSPIPCTPSHMGNIDHDPISLPAGGSVTYRVTGIVDIKFTGTLSNTATATAPDCSASATDDTVIKFTGVKAFCTSISGSAVEGGVITKKFVLINGGPAFQADNPGDEFSDTLPPSLTLTGVSADSGTAAMVGNTATWNGPIPVGIAGMVTINITATINAGTAGTTICNQATINFDADGDGINESSGSSNDCCFLVLFFEIPALSLPGLLALALLLAAFAILRLRRRTP